MALSGWRPPLGNQSEHVLIQSVTTLVGYRPDAARQSYPSANPFGQRQLLPKNKAAARTVEPSAQPSVNFLALSPRRNVPTDEGIGGFTTDSTTQ
jgi:hypothetical protein